MFIVVLDRNHVLVHRRCTRVNENERIVSVVAVAHDEEETAELPEQTAEDASDQNENAALSGAEEKAEE